MCYLEKADLWNPVVCQYKIQSRHSHRVPLMRVRGGTPQGLVVRSPKAFFCRRQRRAWGAVEGHPALTPVFDRPYACTVRQLGPQERDIGPVGPTSHVRHSRISGPMCLRVAERACPWRRPRGVDGEVVDVW